MTFVFWAAVGVIGYAYFGYVAWLLLRRGWHPRRVQTAPYTPFISIVLIVRNEAACLERKMRTLMELDYPADSVQILVMSDGSTDGTNRLLSEFAGVPRVRVILSPEARGKAARLNEALTVVSGEVVVFMDARQKIRKDAVRVLMENFADCPSMEGEVWPSVMVAVGGLGLPAAHSWPARADPGGKTAEQDCHPGMFWIPLMVICDACDVTFTLRSVSELYP